MLFEIFCRRVKAKLVLRKLSTITEKEILEVQPHLFIKTRAIGPTIDDCRMFKEHAETTRLLIKKGFDVFGLIEEGLAIEHLSN